MGVTKDTNNTTAEAVLLTQCGMVVYEIQNTNIDGLIESCEV